MAGNQALKEEFPIGKFNTDVDPATSAKQDTLISHVENVISTLNSTSTPLGISGVFTGTAEDITKYAAVTVTVKSDRASATNGLSIQFSTDGTNWDNVDAHTISAATAHITTNAVQAKYFRVVYTNGTLAQTYFRLQVLYSTEAVGPIIEEMGGDVSDMTSAITTKAVLFAKNPGGVYGSINRTNGGNLKTSLEEIDPSVNIARETGGNLASIKTATESKYITGIGDGRKVVTTAGTALALDTSTPCKKVTITAETDNTGIIVVGGSTVVAALATRRGTPLNAGDSYEFDIDNLADVYLDTTVNGDGVTFTWFS